MPDRRAPRLLFVSLFLPLAFGETAPWQQGTVVSLEQGTYQPSAGHQCSSPSKGQNSSVGCKYWEVTINLADQVLMIRPYVMASATAAKGLGSIDVLLRGAAGRDLKDYVLPQGVSPGMAVKVAVFSNGTVTLQNAGGRNYSAEIVSQTLAPGQKPATVYVEPTISSRPTIIVDQKAEFPWKQVDDPNQRWKFTVRDQFVFGEFAMAPDRQRIGDFFSIDAKKRDDRFVGTARLRATIPSDAGSTRTCEWTFEVELTSVTPDRIEGSLGGEVDQAGCAALGNGAWGAATWIRE
jgi:hypothetical protein